MLKQSTHARRFSVVVGILALITGGMVERALPGQDKRPPDIPVEELIRRIAANESRLRDEFKNFLFKQDFTLQTITGKDYVTGELRRISEIILNDQGKREEKITHFPPSPLSQMMTPADYQDLAGIHPFALTLESLPRYKVTYAGRERVDELNTYLFDVVPLTPPDPKKMNDRYFHGRIWVDTEDLVVVKVRGQSLPEDGRNQFPHFETWRENIEKEIWFPTYTYANDNLEFDSGIIRIRMIVRLKDYRRFTGSIELIPADELPPPKPKG